MQETRERFSSKIHIKCIFCSKVNVVNTLTENNKAGPKNVNKQAVLGAVHAGMRKSQLESIMACLEVPCLSTSCFKDLENNIVGPVLEQEAKSSCKKAIEEELLLTRNDLKGNDGISVSFDQGWQKRDSKSGHSSVIGEKAGKIVDYEVKIKSCRVCDIAVRNGAPPRQHSCRKNHDGSSSMEQKSAVAFLTRLREKGIEVTSFTTDEESTIHHYISIRVPSTIKKRKTDYNHVKSSSPKTCTN